MQIEHPDHQKLLLELINAANFPGHLLELACEVKKALQEAEVIQPV